MEKCTFPTTHLHWHQTTKQFESRGEGGWYTALMWIFLCHSKTWSSAQQRGSVDANENVRCARLCLAEQGAVGLPVTWDLLCLGFAFLSASAWVDSWGPSPSVLLSQVQHLSTRQRNELRTQRRQSTRFLRTSEIYSETMRSPRLVAVLGLITCYCALYTTAAIDIPLEGECWLCAIAKHSSTHVHKGGWFQLLLQLKW